MKNSYLQLFLGFFTAMFAGLFMNKSTSHKDRIYEKMARHNAETYQNLRKSLQQYAMQFMLPLMKRSKKYGTLQHTKKSRKYEAHMKKRKEELLLSRGCEKYWQDDQSVIAINIANAKRKFANMGINLQYATF